MGNKLVSVISLALIFIILGTTIPELPLNANAQGVIPKSNEPLGDKIKSIVNSSLIITPWNTGNNGNNTSAPNNG
ncbi:MAG TPA: hypothetical protein VFT71_08515 [Candidatus Nitrosocosmicus sp.]|nr:hypothetical protein [Candidatus Nitrosocosmicus sp.]